MNEQGSVPINLYLQKQAMGFWSWIEVAQHCKCIKYHWIIHFKMVRFVTYEFQLNKLLLLFLKLFIYFWLHWVFVAVHGLSLVAASGGYSSLWCAGLLRWLLLLLSTGSRCMGFSSCGSRALEQGSVVVAHGLSCSAACGIFLDQGSNPCPLHWQVDS